MNILPAEIVRVALAAMQHRPCVDYYPGDWFRDPVSGASIRARGFWHTAILVMHDAKPYGHLVGANGLPLNRDQILTRFQMRKPSELKLALDELDALGIPGRSGDASYEKILRSEPATIRLAGVEWTLDLSPLGVTTAGVIYSRRMLRDRRKSLVRFIVSPTGQALILPLTQHLRQGLTPQNSSVCTPPPARAYVEDEDEEKKKLGSLSQLTKSPEGVQGEPPTTPTPPSTPDFAAVERVSAKFDGSALRTKPSLQIVTALLGEFGEELILETLVDCEPQYAGKGYQYFEQILTTRRDDPSQRPGQRRAKGNGNGRDQRSSANIPKRKTGVPDYDDLTEADFRDGVGNRLYDR